MPLRALQGEGRGAPRRRDAAPGHRRRRGRRLRQAGAAAPARDAPDDVARRKREDGRRDRPDARAYTPPRGGRTMSEVPDELATLIAEVRHDTNNALMAIFGHVELLLLRQGLPED